MESLQRRGKNKVYNMNWEHDAVLSKGRVLLISEMPFQWSGGRRWKPRGSQYKAEMKRKEMEAAHAGHSSKYHHKGFL